MHNHDNLGHHHGNPGHHHGHHHCQPWPPRPWPPYHPRHVHEFAGSTEIAQAGFNPHNHRFAGVSGTPVTWGNSHIHNISTRTDSTDHFHNLQTQTGAAISVGGGRHVHFADDFTTADAGHRHRYRFATMIERPTD